MIVAGRQKRLALILLPNNNKQKSGAPNNYPATESATELDETLQLPAF